MTGADKLEACVAGIVILQERLLAVSGASSGQRYISLYNTGLFTFHYQLDSRELLISAPVLCVACQECSFLRHKTLKLLLD